MSRGRARPPYTPRMDSASMDSDAPDPASPDRDADLDQLAGIPTTFGGYKILEMVERVGGARVFLARQASVDRLVTLTVLPEPHGEKAAFKKRFERQILAASRLNHPNVICAVDAGAVTGHRYIASEYAGGQRLSEALTRREWFGIRRCVAIALDIANALSHLESRRVIHRGVTPRAIVLAESGVAKLRGFSLSKLMEGEASQTWFDVDAYGARYMSPEIVQSARIVDTRADIYSFGCVLYHLLTGQAPFSGKYTQEITKKQVEELPPEPRDLREDLPDDLRGVVLKCLRKDAALRYRTAAELVADLKAVQHGEPTGPAARPRQRKRGWISKIFTTDD